MIHPMRTRRIVDERVCPFCDHRWTPRKAEARQCPNPKCKKVLPTAAGPEPRMGYTFTWTFTMRELRDLVTGGQDVVLDGDQLRALFPRGVAGPMDQPTIVKPPGDAAARDAPLKSKSEG